VRRLMTLTLASSAIVAIACGKDKAPTSAAMSADLKRDLQLASATQDLRINPDEVAPSANQELSLKPKRAPEGPRVVRTENPTVQASAAPVEAAEVKTDMPEVQVSAPADPVQAETQASDAPPLARPAPLPTPTYPAGNVNAGGGSGSGNGGIGSVIGAIFGGAVVRGGRVGDDDHCDPRHGSPRRRPDVYAGTGVAYPGGMGGMRIPVRPISRQRP
jgi:hypothetical protein